MEGGESPEGGAQASAGRAGSHPAAPHGTASRQPPGSVSAGPIEKRKKPGQGRASLWLLVKPGPADREEVSLSRWRGRSDSFLPPRLCDTAEPRNYPKAANQVGPRENSSNPTLATLTSHFPPPTGKDRPHLEQWIPWMRNTHPLT